MSINTQLLEALRQAIQDVRRKPYPIKDLIPLLTQAADALAAAERAPAERVPASQAQADAIASLLRQVQERQAEDASTPVTLTSERAAALMDVVWTAMGAAPQPEAAPAAQPTMEDAIAAGDGTLHGAIDHWQERALKAEAEVARLAADVGPLLEAVGKLEVEAAQPVACDNCAKLRTVMVAAAEEIAAHWLAHCDAEGYGPSNLMRRLEDGIPSQYGYTAGAFARLKAENEALKAAQPAPDVQQAYRDMKAAQPVQEPAWQEAARQALMALEDIRPQNMGRLVYPAIAALRDALGIDAAQPQREPLTEEQIEALAHRTAWRYKHSSDPAHSDTYTFNRATLLDFARKLGGIGGGQ